MLARYVIIDMYINYVELHSSTVTNIEVSDVKKTEHWIV